MVDFSFYPKQWLLSKADLAAPLHGKSDQFAGWNIQAAETAPLHRLVDAEGQELGRLIGWVIVGETFHDTDGTVALAPGETAEAFHARLGGRFVLLWRAADGSLRLRMDVAGALATVFAPEHEIVAATTSLMGEIVPLETDDEIASIFDFPKRRGFLPFGLTAIRGVQRLLPSFELNLSRFSARRVWPAPEDADAPKVSRAEAKALAEEAALIMRRHVHAVLATGTAEQPVTLFLSGGVDSRMVLAAAKGMTDRLTAETIGISGSMDCHVAASLAKLAGIPHRRIAPVKASPAQIEAWLHRTGHTIYDPVTDISATAEANPPAGHALTGTVCDLSKGKHFEAKDMERADMDVDLLLLRLRLPDTPPIRQAAQAWLESFPASSAVYALDMAKIDIIYGCWSSTAGYGHDLPRPSISPFANRRLFDIVLAVPLDYRRDKSFLKDYMKMLWPELMSLPINRAAGLARLRFLKTELRDLVPTSVRRAIKPLR